MRNAPHAAGGERLSLSRMNGMAGEMLSHGIPGMRMGRGGKALERAHYCAAARSAACLVAGPGSQRPLVLLSGAVAVGVHQLIDVGLGGVIVGGGAWFACRRRQRGRERACSGGIVQRLNVAAIGRVLGEVVGAAAIAVLGADVVGLWAGAVFASADIAHRLALACLSEAILASVLGLAEMMVVLVVLGNTGVFALPCGLPFCALPLLRPASARAGASLGVSGQRWLLADVANAMRVCWPGVGVPGLGGPTGHRADTILVRRHFIVVTTFGFRALLFVMIHPGIGEAVAKMAAVLVVPSLVALP